MHTQKKCADGRSVWFLLLIILLPLGLIAQTNYKEQRAVVDSLETAGSNFYRQGAYLDAITCWEEALTIKLDILTPQHPDVALSYNNIGVVYDNLGEYGKALDNHEKALAIFLKALGEEHPHVAQSYNNIGAVYRSQNQPDSALYYYEKSIDIFEKNRDKVESEELRATYTETVTNRYETIISLLLEMDRPEEAFEYLERSKSKSLQEAIDEKYDLELGTGKIRDMIKQTRTLATKIEVFEKQLLEERMKPDSTRIDAKIENLSSQLAEVRSEYDSLSAEIEADPDYAFIVKVEPVKLSEIRKNLPEGQKLLMVYSGVNQLYLFLVSHDGYVGKSYPVTREAMNNYIAYCNAFCTITTLSELNKIKNWKWEDDGSEFYTKEVEPFKEILHNLYKTFIEPLEEELATAEIVTIIPSGELNYLPWGAML
ncbi:tetratricopeptide repeat protein, partial [candidate division WOR-3 bacterium]|nr:tetratricopeptide repeat protein [candidate division WOR-3 bacterium]MBD3363705.1 tetratricopeptide repeat protein [candidate division WOR-3 bacterium]